MVCILTGAAHRHDGRFFQGMLTEGVTEGLSNAGSFGLGKVLDAVKRGIQERKSRVAGGSRGISTNSKVDKIAKQAREWLGDDVRLVTKLPCPAHLTSP